MNSKNNIINVKSPPPFPQRMTKQKDELRFQKFIDLLKQVHINLPLIYILLGVPMYAKYIKGIIANRIG